MTPREIKVKIVPEVDAEAWKALVDAVADEVMDRLKQADQQRRQQIIGH